MSDDLELMREIRREARYELGELEETYGKCPRGEYQNVLRMIVRERLPYEEAHLLSVQTRIDRWSGRPVIKEWDGMHLLRSEAEHARGKIVLMRKLLADQARL